MFDDTAVSASHMHFWESDHRIKMTFKLKKSMAQEHAAAIWHLNHWKSSDQEFLKGTRKHDCCQTKILTSVINISSWHTCASDCPLSVWTMMRNEWKYSGVTNLGSKLHAVAIKTMSLVSEIALIWHTTLQYGICFRPASPCSCPLEYGIYSKRGPSIFTSWSCKINTKFLPLCCTGTRLAFRVNKLCFSVAE